MHYREKTSFFGLLFNLFERFYIEHLLYLIIVLCNSNFASQDPDFLVIVLKVVFNDSSQDILKVFLSFFFGHLLFFHVFMFSCEKCFLLVKPTGFIGHSTLIYESFKH